MKIFLLFFFAISIGAPAYQTKSPAGVYSGVLPCADCPGIRSTIQFNSDNTFLMEEIYLKAENGKDRGYYTLGKWSVDGDKVTLNQGTDRQRLFALKNATTLRMLDVSGNEINSKLNYNLRTSRKAFKPKNPFAMTGYFSYMADSARFVECYSGKSFPVANAGDYLNLEREYSKTRSKPNEKIFAKVEGYVSGMAKMEGAGLIDTVVVSKFDSFDKNASCPQGSAGAAAVEGRVMTAVKVEDTYWKLVELNGRAVRAGDTANDPHINLTPNGSRVVGSSGCNRIVGTYNLDGTNLTFGPAASTRMMCMKGMNLESDFLKALQEVKTYKIADGWLELYNGDKLLAIFKSK